MRLTPLARDLGLIADMRWRAYQERRERVAAVRNRLESERRSAQEWQELFPDLIMRHTLTQNPQHSLWELLGRDELNFTQLGKSLPELGLQQEHAALLRHLKAERLYSDHTGRQQKQMDLFRRDEALSLPLNLDYWPLAHLSFEEKERLSRLRPQTLGQAARVEGITPASLLFLHALCRTKRAEDKSAQAILR